MSKFLRTEKGLDYFEFICVGCQCKGELGILCKIGMEPFGCPEGCGATYVRWTPTKGEPPVLKCVVQPVFSKDFS